MSAAWVHGFRNSESGPIGQIHGSTARLDAQIDSLVVGLTIKYGGKRLLQAEPTPAAPAPSTVAEASP